MFKTDPELSIAGRMAGKTLRTIGVEVLTLLLAQQSLHALMVEAHFLFKRDLNEYLEELNKHCTTVLLEIEGTHPTPIPSATPSWPEVSEWFSKQDPIVVKQKFESYLRLS